MRIDHGLKMHSDGTLEITMPEGVNVGRVLVNEAGTQYGALYYKSKEGTWGKHYKGQVNSVCSECGKEVGRKTRYCPACGARMEDVK